MTSQYLALNELTKSTNMKTPLSSLERCTRLSKTTKAL